MYRSESSGNDSGIYALIDQPSVQPGSGPHGSKAVCAHCGVFLRWLPKEKGMAHPLGINKVILLGTIGERGVTVRYRESGTPVASLSIEAKELGQNGQVFTTYVNIEVFGKGAEAAGELTPGTVVYVDGTLKWSKDPAGHSLHGTLQVQTWRVTPMGDTSHG